jgi:hypothetical protein
MQGKCWRRSNKQAPAANTHARTGTAFIQSIGIIRPADPVARNLYKDTATAGKASARGLAGGSIAAPADDRLPGVLTRTNKPCVMQAGGEA